MNRLGMVLFLALAAVHAAGADAPQFVASIQVVESSPGAVSRAAKSGAVIFALRAALPSDRIFQASARRPLNAALAVWRASESERRASGAHPLGTEPREVTAPAVIPCAGDYLASVIVFDAEGRVVAESTSTQFHF